MSAEWNINGLKIEWLDDENVVVVGGVRLGEDDLFGLYAVIRSLYNTASRLSQMKKNDAIVRKLGISEKLLAGLPAKGISSLGKG